MNPHNSPNPSAPAEDFTPGGGTTASGGVLAETKSKITDTTREAVSKVKDATSSTAARAKEQAQRLAAEKKETTANRIGSYSSAIHETARSLEEQDPNIAWFTHRAADRLQGIADYMRTHDMADMRRDAENMARRHPGMFFGGLFLAGLVIGNMMKASRSRLDEDYDYAGGGDDEPDWARPGAGEGGAHRSELNETERSTAGL